MIVFGNLAKNKDQEEYHISPHSVCIILLLYIKAICWNNYVFPI